MRTLLYLSALGVVVGLGFWAYAENVATQEALREVRELQREIAADREALSVQRAEWAYLNRPDRLRDLVDLNYEALRLQPMAPENLGRIDEVPFPPSEADFVTLSTSSSNDTGEQEP